MSPRSHHDSRNSDGSVALLHVDDVLGAAREKCDYAVARDHITGFGDDDMTLNGYLYEAAASVFAPMRRPHAFAVEMY